MLSGIELIAAERERQIAEEGWTSSHDNRQTNDELSRAATCYACPPRFRQEIPLKEGALGEGWAACSVREAVCSVPDGWPWSPLEWKSGDSRIRELVKAGALIAAEIDRLQRGQWTN